MKMRFLCLVTLLASVVTNSAFSAENDVGFSITDLGTSFGPIKLNNNGQMAGDINGHAGFYSGGHVTDLGTLGGSFSNASGINDSGVVVGNAWTNNSPVVHAFSDANGHMTDLQTLSGSGNSEANAINNSGVIVGDSHVDGMSAPVAFIYQNGQMTTIHGLEHVSSGAEAISSSGLIAGGYYPNGGNVEDAFLFDGTVHDLGGLGGTVAFALGVNDAGVVVGQSGVAADRFGHAFVYSGGQMGSLSFGGPSGTSTAVNSLGQVVGLADLSEDVSHGFLYEQGQLIDLNSLIDPSSGWTIVSAADINDLGQIVAYGVDASSVTHALLLSPLPEPSMDVAALLSGMWLLVCRRNGGRRKFKGVGSL